MPKPTWFNSNGVLLNEHEAEFLQLALDIEALLLPFEGRMPYRDLYDLARDAGLTAAGRRLIEHVNQPKKSRRPKKK